MVRRPDWFTVSGGSHSYLRAFLSSFQGRVRLSAPVGRVRPVPAGYEVEGCLYDKVVLATHADIALSQLQQPTALQRQALGNWRYLANHTISIKTPVVCRPTGACALPGTICAVPASTSCPP